MQSTGKLSKEEFQRRQDLEAARKAGTAPPAVDEDGNEINPHIPQYIVQAPWYIDSGIPTLKHQKVSYSASSSSSSSKLNDWYARGARAGPAATKFRKGACENCGAMSHKTKECMERPRKKGAKWTGEDIMADEVVGSVDLGFEAKRDRWNGYDTNEYTQQLKEWEMVEAQRKKIKAKKLDEELKARAARGEEMLAEVDTSSDEDDADEDKYADAADMAGQHVDTKSRQTVRNLRIREDVPKYLRNLDLNSAHYDPKTRSMRENPYKDSKKNPDEVDYAGDAAFRFSGDASKVTETMLFAMRAAERGNDVHAHANPSQAEFAYREHLKKRDEVKDKKKSSILERYGGEEHLSKPPPELLQQTEDYVEYSRTGRVIKGAERVKARSKYAEDQLHNNHTSVWGSYWRDGSWGYACCHNTVYNSYCTGEAGKEANAAAAMFGMSAAASAQAEPVKSLAEQHAERLAEDKKKGKKGADKKPTSSSNNSTVPAHKRKLGELDVQLSSEKLAEALEREKKRQKSEKDGPAGNRWDAKEVTEEELEAHRMLRTRRDDPMANFKDGDV
ncbi:Pre-mRNA splicing Prp18-interacting factor-domain-containing protein [Catenaria anguillulae PL171]|uniref:Pre-mRNA-splicing factor SLU7 n=1 Tax=Catenaria anguillulae PL171 TaxID=765915 RepID=A0A1Y2HU46_9FUNG|nr:Pre-mRNA splicing Prp18-interacting factor-domain-containing protein [Catenaria anguillulae PL171]